jgi:hypothetical protein
VTTEYSLVDCPDPVAFSHSVVTYFSVKQKQLFDILDMQIGEFFKNVIGRNNE